MAGIRGRTHRLTAWIGLAAAGLSILGGCAAVDSLFSRPTAPPAPTPPSPPAQAEPAPSIPKGPPSAPAQAEPVPSIPKEPPAPPAKREPAPPAKRTPPVQAPKKEPPAPPAKREPAPVPTSKEPEAPAVKKEPEQPAPVLAPQVGREDEEQLRRETAARIQQGERLAAQLEEKPLTEEQREQLLTIRSFFGKAREAVAERDLARASNLADKARILADELAQRVR